MDELVLTHSRLTSLPPLSSSLKIINVRQNIITSFDEIVRGCPSLNELILYDNRIHLLPQDLSTLCHLKFLDLSFNNLQDNAINTEFPSSLDILYLASNLLTKVPSVFCNLTYLRILELGANDITEISGLDSLDSLEELWLGRNCIRKIENLQNLRKLKILSLQNNYITKIEGLENLESLEELYISFNKIEHLENLSLLASHLKVLDIAYNQITSCTELRHLYMLRELWMNNNKLSLFKDLYYLSSLVFLNTIYAEGNPFCDANYRRKLMLLLPHISQIDALPVSRTMSD